MTSSTPAWATGRQGRTSPPDRRTTRKRSQVNRFELAGRRGIPGNDARQTLDKLNALDVAVTGIGAGGIVPPLPAGDNFFTDMQVAQARKRGAVGELNLRYIDEDGKPVHTDVDDLVVGITLEQLRRADRRLGVAGGPSKYQALRAALLGGWLNIVVTDATTAQWLIDNRG